MLISCIRKKKKKKNKTKFESNANDAGADKISRSRVKHELREIMLQRERQSTWMGNTQYRERVRVIYGGA